MPGTQGVGVLGAQHTLRYHSAMRTIVEQLNSLLQAYGYRTAARRERVSFEDVGALARGTQLIVAGRAQAITQADVMQNQPNFVVLEDNPPAGQLDRISAICHATESAPLLLGGEPLHRPDLACRHCIAVGAA
jgi:hypothetical protein